jgi:hypothetical protein
MQGSYDPKGTQFRGLRLSEIGWVSSQEDPQEIPQEIGGLGSPDSPDQNSITSDVALLDSAGRKATLFGRGTLHLIAAKRYGRSRWLPQSLSTVKAAESLSLGGVQWAEIISPQ